MWIRALKPKVKIVEGQEQPERIGQAVPAGTLGRMLDVVERARNLNLQAAVLAVMKAVPFIKRDPIPGVGSMTGVMERTVLRALRPAMIEHGLTLMPIETRVLPQPPAASKEGKLTLRTMIEEKFLLTHVPSGETQIVSSCGESSDASDKGNTKAMTGSLKTVLRRLFLCETGKDPEKANPQHYDAETGHVKPPRQPTQEEVLAEIAAAQAAANQPANPPAGPVAEMLKQAVPEPVADPADPVTREQVAEIERNFTTLATNEEKQRQILTQRGVKFLRELTQVQAAELIAAQAKAIAKRAAEAKAKN